MANLLYKLQHNIIWDINGIPGKIYKEAKDDFLAPKIKSYFFRKDSDFYLTDLCYQDYAFVTMDDMDWKTKFGDYRFEWLPYVIIKLFKWRLLFVWEAPDGDNLRYYELMLNYLYKYNKDYNKIQESYGWSKWENGKWIPITKDYRKNKQK